MAKDIIEVEGIKTLVYPTPGDWVVLPDNTVVQVAVNRGNKLLVKMNGTKEPVEVDTSSVKRVHRVCHWADDNGKAI